MSLKTITITISSLVVLLLILSIARNPLRLPDIVIKDYLLSELPLGTNIKVVEQFVREKEWKLAYVSRTTGYIDQQSPTNKVVGEMSIRAELGSYQGLPFETSVTVFWGFDKKGNLIDMWVWKTRDGI